MYAAPWGRLLKGISAGVEVLMGGIAITGVTSGSGLLVLLLPLFLILALPFGGVLGGCGRARSTFLDRSMP